jgi:iron complex outermembrane recepter protein
MGQFGGWQTHGGLGCLDAEYSNSACISDTNSSGTDTGRD